MMRWLVDDGSPSDRRYVNRVLNSIQEINQQVLVPYIWVYESAFVVNYYVGEGALSTVQAASHLKALYDLCTVAIDREPPATLFDFSRAHGVSAYDAAYLIMALSQGSKIATLDKKMRHVARKLDIEIFPGKSKSR
jgi:predicted nucleic acid-binding protein